MAGQALGAVMMAVMRADPHLRDGRSIILKGRRTPSKLLAGAALVLTVAACSATTAAARAAATSHAGSTAGTHSGSTSSSRTAVESTTTTDWTVYHRYVSGSGRGPAHLVLSHVRSAWTSKALDGELYGNPLVWGKDVYVATENDTVYALSAAHGSVVWSHHLARAAWSSGHCGNIGPTVGITGTPVIDTARNEIFVVADELVNGAPRHELYGLNTSTGKVEMRQDADPPGAATAFILQRASLTLDEGRVVFGYGGNYGDCEPYHGWVESVPATGGKALFFEVDHGSGQSQGAVWMGGGPPVVTSNGDVFVATGNGSSGNSGGAYDDSDAVLELSPTMKLLQYFAPSSWRNDNSTDADLGSAVPAVLPNGLVVQAGKSRTAFLLRASHLGGVGGQIDEIGNFCGADVDGGIAFLGGTAYLPCESGVIAVATDVKTGKIRQLWQTPTGSGGPPILAGGYVWTIGNGSLYALDPTNGHAVEQLSVGSEATDFPTPSVGDGLVLAPSSDQVHAFRQS
jgi:outer membrane protein assembly factor BamB